MPRNPINTQISRDDYLRLDAAATEKHEFYRGQMFAMAGGTYQHARIGLNATTELAVRLRGKPCQHMNVATNSCITAPSPACKTTC